MTVCPHCGGPLGDEKRFVEWGGWSLDTQSGYLNSVVRLTPQECRILSILLGGHGNVVRHDTLISAMYFQDPDAEVEQANNLVKVVLSKIRKKVSAIDMVIGTAWGRGYFVEEMDVEHVIGKSGNGAGSKDRGAVG